MSCPECAKKDQALEALIHGPPAMMAYGNTMLPIDTKGMRFLIEELEDVRMKLATAHAIIRRLKRSFDE